MTELSPEAHRLELSWRVSELEASLRLLRADALAWRRKTNSDMGALVEQLLDVEAEVALLRELVGPRDRDPRDVPTTLLPTSESLADATSDVEKAR